MWSSCKSSPSAKRDLGEGDREAVEGVEVRWHARATPSVPSGQLPQKGSIFGNISLPMKGREG